MTQAVVRAVERALHAADAAAPGAHPDAALERLKLVAATARKDAAAAEAQRAATQQVCAIVAAARSAPDPSPNARNEGQKAEWAASAWARADEALYKKASELLGDAHTADDRQKKCDKELQLAVAEVNQTKAALDQVRRNEASSGVLGKAKRAVRSRQAAPELASCDAAYQAADVERRKKETPAAAAKDFADAANLRNSAMRLAWRKVKDAVKRYGDEHGGGEQARGRFRGRGGAVRMTMWRASANVASRLRDVWRVKTASLLT